MARIRRIAIALVFVSAVLFVTAEFASAQLGDPNHETTTTAVALTVAESRCRISDDSSYGTTKENPIKTGGGVMNLAAREVRYLSALRGPAGEGVHFVRQGSVPGGPDVYLDIYKLDYPAAKALTLYIDGYHWDPPLAPKGLMCGIDMNLPPPGPDPVERTKTLWKMALELSDADVAPISLDPDGSRTHGVVFDHVRLIANAGRAAAASGKPLDVERMPSDVARARLIAVALPRTCAGVEQTPKSIVIADRNANSPAVLERLHADAISKRVPGYTAPAHAIAVSYGAGSLIEGARATVEYSDRCSEEEPREVLMPVKVERGRVLRAVPPATPAGAMIPPEGAQVQLQVFLGADGVPQHPAFVAGAWDLREAAGSAVRDWRIEPTKHNGSPVLQPSTVTVRFAR